MRSVDALRAVCLSDTHLRRPAGLPQWCVQRIRGAHVVVHAGDVTTLPVLKELARLAPLEAVHGNMDEPALKKALPARRVIELGSTRIGVLHDGGPSHLRGERLAREFPDCDAIIYGHTHQPEILRCGGVLVLNPGSPTAPRAGAGPTMIELIVHLNGELEASFLFP